MAVRIHAKDPSLVALGAALKRLRLKSGLSQEKLANLAAIHHNYVSALERGEMNISYKTMRRIARALRVPLSKWVSAAE